MVFHSCNSYNLKIAARPDLATQLVQIVIQNISNSLLCQKGQLTLQPCPRRWFVKKIFGYYQYLKKVKIDNSS